MYKPRKNRGHGIHFLEPNVVCPFKAILIGSELWGIIFSKLYTVEILLLSRRRSVENLLQSCFFNQAEPAQTSDWLKIKKSRNIGRRERLEIHRYTWIYLVSRIDTLTGGSDNAWMVEMALKHPRYYKTKTTQYLQKKKKWSHQSHEIVQ